MANEKQDLYTMALMEETLGLLEGKQLSPKEFIDCLRDPQDEETFIRELTPMELKLCCLYESIMQSIGHLDGIDTSFLAFILNFLTQLRDYTITQTFHSGGKCLFFIRKWHDYPALYQAPDNIFLEDITKDLKEVN